MSLPRAVSSEADPSFHALTKGEAHDSAVDHGATYKQ